MSKCKGFYRHRIAAVCDNCIYRKKEIDSDSQCLNCIKQTKKGKTIYSNFTEITFEWTEEELERFRKEADERSSFIDDEFEQMY